MPAKSTNLCRPNRPGPTQASFCKPATREQGYDPLLIAPVAGWSVNGHIHQGAQAALAGEGLARYFIWDAKRSLDYLAIRPQFYGAKEDLPPTR